MSAVVKNRVRLRWGRYWSERGQSSVEYALVVIALLCMVLALGALWHAGRDGVLLNQAVGASSHQVGGSDVLGSMRDIALF